MTRPGTVAALLVAAGCAPTPLGLVVDVKTDLAPGTEFSAVSATLHGVGVDIGRAAPVFLADDFAMGRRVAEYDQLPPGDYTLTTSLLDTAHTVIVSRVALVTIRDDLALTVVMSRECRGVVCPRASDPSTSTTCAGGSCVDPRCTGSDHSLCPTGCTTDAMCSAHAPCATTRCVDGACLYFAGSSCTATERCDPDVGCVPAMITCSTPLLDCGGMCTDVDVDEAHCGSCTHACTAPTNATATCVGGTCGFTCNSGFHHCDAACSAMPCGGTFGSAATSMFPVPDGCTRLDVVAWGAGGGRGFNTGAGQPPGAGGFASATLDVTPGEMLTVVVGEPGGAGTASVGGIGGVPGGGHGGTVSGGGGGGGYTGVFRGAPAATTALVIAGGGGGSGGKGYLGGAGGGFVAENASAGGGGSGGTQTAGGTPGGTGTAGGALTGGTGGSRTDGGGGGGAGWFGGGGQGASSNASGGGGGSGYVTPTATAYALASGTGGTTVGAGDTRRGTAGDPAMPGLVLLTCE